MNAWGLFIPKKRNVNIERHLRENGDFFSCSHLYLNSKFPFIPQINQLNITKMFLFQLKKINSVFLRQSSGSQLIDIGPTKPCWVFISAFYCHCYSIFYIILKAWKFNSEINYCSVCVIKKTYQQFTELFIIKHFIFVLFCKFFTQGNGLFPHLLEKKSQNNKKKLNYIPWLNINIRIK